MHDKNLDQLFRSKLDKFEAEPGAGVWANISSELAEPKKRRGGMLWLRIAASILVLISTGLFLLPKKQVEVIKPKNQLAENHPGNKPVIVSPVTIATLVNITAKVQLNSNAKSQQTLVAVVHHATVQQSVTIPVTKVVTPDLVKTTPQVNDQQQVLAATSNTSITQPVVPDATTPLINKIIDVQPITKSTAVLTSVNEKDVSPAPAKKRKIHGLGSFLNAVVAVVDKREDKFIEFTDTNEGNMVTGINLGITIKKNQ